jgi:uncharacterized protein (DUF1697 family)
VTRYVALLRGINVGGKNLIKMADLRACFEGHGYHDVATYIQSGNVLFSTGSRSSAALTADIESMLAANFDYDASVVLRSEKQMRSTVEGAPAWIGADPASYRYDVIFLKPALSASSAIKSVPTRDGVDRAATGPGVLYFSRLTSRATQSHLSRIVSMPIYKDMTIRNWNTTTKLLRLME